MPRQDVPYGGAICRLKERIAEIWDKLGEKLHSINGVEGDAAGDVKIVSADPAVVITNNAASHEIEIGLDSLELPSATVQSVNGQTGAVVLTADEIGSDGNSNVQRDIDDLYDDVNANVGAIAAEAMARVNADSALQTNINAALASIPEMSVTPDPYKGVERDAQGRAYGADPASGATDKSLTTANWISQTGDNSPNNLMHKSANEKYTGIKTNQKSMNTLTATMQITDYSLGTNPTNPILLEGYQDASNNWLIEARMGQDNNGARAFYQKAVRLTLANTSYTIPIRINLTSSGLNVQILDPINNQWKNVQLV